MAGLIACSAMATVLTPSAMPSAVAATGTTGAGIYVTPAGYGEVWLGAYEPPAGVTGLAWCRQMRVYPGAGQAPQTSGDFNDRVLQYITETWESDNTEARRAAIGYTVHMRAELPGSMAGGDVAAAQALLEAATPANVKALSAQMVAEAESQAGPYTGSQGTVTDTTLRYGYVDGMGAKSASGNWVSGLAYTATLQTLSSSGTWVTDTQAFMDVNNNNKIDPGEGQTVSGTTPAAALRFNYVATGPKRETRIKFTVSGLKTRKLVSYGMGENFQDNMVLIPSLTGADPTMDVTSPPFTVAGDFRPMGESSAPVFIDVGEDITDVFTAKVHPEDTWEDGVPMTYAYTVTRLDSTTPAAESDQAPAGEVIGEGTEVFTGVGDTSDVNLGEAEVAGPYVFTWATSRDIQPEASREWFREGWSWTDGTSHEETTIVRYPTKVTSALSIRETANGVMLVDEQWNDMLSDAGAYAGDDRWRADEQWVYTQMYKIVGEAPTADSCTAETAFGDPIKVPANRGYFGPNSDLSWQVDKDVTDTTYYVAVHDFAGDDRSAPYTSACDDVTQTYKIDGEPVSATTQIQTDREVKAGAEVTFVDKTDVVGSVPSSGLDLTNYLYQSQGQTLVCSEENIVDIGGVIAVDKAGTYMSAETTTTVEGDTSYGYVEVLTDKDGYVVYRGECGAETETVYVPKGPSVWTKAQSETDDPKVGDDIWDLIGTEGDFEDGSTTGADLYYAEPGDELTCDDPIWSSESIDIVADKDEYETDRYTTDRQGTYGFVETTYDPDGEVISTGVCGEPDETITIRAGDADTAQARLALTGGNLALAGVVAALLAAGVLFLVSRRRLAANLAAQGDSAPETDTCDEG